MGDDAKGMTRREVLLQGAALGGLALAGTGLGLPAWAQAQGDWQAGAGPEWRQLLDEARKEGTVTVAVQLGVLAEPIATAFECDTGLKAEILVGRPPDQVARLSREARAGNVTIDVSVGGTGEISLIKEGLLVPIKPQLILPSVADPKNWTGGKLLWMDNDQTYMFQTTNWVHGWALINNKIVDPKTFTSWKDLLKPEFKGKIAADDPQNPGPGQAAAAYLGATFGIDFVKQLYVGQQVVYTRDARQLVEWVARGTHAVGLGCIVSAMEPFRRQGMTQLEVPYLADGPGALTGGFSVVKQAKGAPHPKAAQVFINWFGSRPGQEVYSRWTMEPSARADVKIDSIPDFVVPRPGAKYLNQYEETWYLTERTRLSTAINQALGR
jgi:ABC-type Fe3+ transport system substrate-binding protein